MIIKYITGDLFELLPYDTKPVKFIVHIVNDIGAWGSGFVVPLGKKFPQARQEYLSWHKNATTFNTPFNLGEYQAVCVESTLNAGPIYVVNLVGQSGIMGATNVKPVKYWAISKALSYLHGQILRYRYTDNEDEHIPEIYAPLFGTGLAGGNWDIIEAILYERFVDVPVTIYQLPGQELR